MFEETHDADTVLLTDVLLGTGTFPADVVYKLECKAIVDIGTRDVKVSVVKEISVASLVL